MLGTMLSKEEVDDFMREADVVKWISLENINLVLFSGWKLDYDEFVNMMQTLIESKCGPD